MLKWLVAVALIFIVSSQAAVARTPVADSERQWVQADVRTILAQRDYQSVAPGKSPWSSALSRARRALAPLWDGLRRLLRWLTPSRSPGASWLYYVVLAASLAALGWGLAVAVRALVRGAAVRSAATDRAMREAALPDAPEDLAPESWAKHARALALRGDHSGAYRAAFTALLLELERLNLLRFARSKTVGEYLREVPRSHAIRPAFAGAARSFETHVYGNRLPGEPDVEAMLAHYDGARQEPEVHVGEATT
ncbi:MAG: DUF4129 domain-containing protein [Armatimonadetes bacterium]|nr:DUF4129 domain-containing protein [Armatimonadota bacterium]